VHVMAKEVDLTKIYQAAGKHHPLEISVGDQKYLALIKDAHFNPVKRRLEHVVFQAIKRNEKVEAEVPIHLEGEIPAEKVGLMVLRQLDTVQLEAFPRNLPDSLKVDAGKLAELHDKITVADLEVPEGVTILTEADHPIATVAETRAQVAEEAAAEGEEGAGGDEESAEGSAPAGAEKDAAGQQATDKPSE
jgi:large subunit ribosomal protein L25